MKKQIWKRLFVVLLCLALVGGITVLGINGHVKKSTADQIISHEEAAALTDVDCILVLGCYVHECDRCAAGTDAGLEILRERRLRR